MTILLSDPSVAAIPVDELGEPLVKLQSSFGPARVLVRASVAQRLLVARGRVPFGLGLRVLAGHRQAADQQALVDARVRQLRSLHGEIADEELDYLAAKFATPVALSPHVAGAAVDVTLVDGSGQELDMGTSVGSAPVLDDETRQFESARISDEARTNRATLAHALRSVGMAGYPAAWWHWSYGDRYWAHVTGSPTAHYGPVSVAVKGR